MRTQFHQDTTARGIGYLYFQRLCIFGLYGAIQMLLLLLLL